MQIVLLNMVQAFMPGFAVATVLLLRPTVILGGRAALACLFAVTGEVACHTNALWNSNFALALVHLARPFVICYRQTA